jgi:hypothetical protein
MADDQNDEARLQVPPDIEAAVANIEASRGKRFVERFIALGLDPKTEFAGGDWRNCDFSDSDLTDCDFRNARLYRANFKHALVNGADFRGASDVHTTRIHLSYGWQDARFDDYQVALIYSQIEELKERKEGQARLYGSDLDAKEWFYLVKACPTFDEARELLGRMEAAGHRLNAFAYTLVLDRAKRDRKRRAGWALYEYFRDAGGECDEALLTAAMGVSPSSQQALAIFNQLQSDLAIDGNVPQERTFNMIISEQDDNFSAALALFYKMVRQKITVSRYTIFALFDACQSFHHAVTVLIEAKRNGIEIDDSDFLKEVQNTTRYPEIDDWNVSVWLQQGLSYREVIRRLIWAITKDPVRGAYNEALGFPNVSPFK